MALSGSNSGLTEAPGSTSVADIATALGFTPTTSNPLTSFAAGTAYTLTNTPAAITFGTTSPSITINSPGTYLLIARSKLIYNAATFAANQTATSKLRRTNNTAGDLTNGSAVVTTSIITLITALCSDQTWFTTYTTTNSNDIISLFADVTTIPGAGSLQCAEASIIAIRLQ